MSHDILCQNETADGDILNCSDSSLDNQQQMNLVSYAPIWTAPVLYRVVVLLLTMLVTFTGNTALLVLIKRNRASSMQRKINMYLINLAVGDLMVCVFTMTTEVLFVVFNGSWVLGAAACKILLYIQMFTIASTTFILIAMTFDRYMAFCHPLRSYPVSTAKKILCISWFLAGLFASPQLFIFKQYPAGIYPDDVIMYKCGSEGYTAWWQRKTYFTFFTAYILVIPAIAITTFYSKINTKILKRAYYLPGRKFRCSVRYSQFLRTAKYKSLKMSICIVLIFALCWIPYFTVHLVHIWSEYRYKIPNWVYITIETLALCNSAANPMIYYYFVVWPRQKSHSTLLTSVKEPFTGPTYKSTSVGVHWAVGPESVQPKKNKSPSWLHGYQQNRSNIVAWFHSSRDYESCVWYCVMIL